MQKYDVKTFDESYACSLYLEIDSYITEREKLKDNYKGNDYSLRRDYIARELNGIVTNEGDTSYIKQVTPSSLKAHLKQLLKKGNLHIGYLTTE